MGEARRKRGQPHHYELVFFTIEDAFLNPDNRRLTVVENFVRRFRNNEKPLCGACDNELPPHPFVFYSLIPWNSRDMEFGGAICRNCSAQKPDPIANTVMSKWIENVKEHNNIVEVQMVPPTNHGLQ